MPSADPSPSSHSRLSGSETSAQAFACLSHARLPALALAAGAELAGIVVADVKSAIA